MMFQVHNEVLQWGLDRLHWPAIVGACWWFRGVLLKAQTALEESRKEQAEQTTLLRDVKQNTAIFVDRKM